MSPASGTGQSRDSVAANARYFLEHLNEYDRSVAQIDTYATIHRFISRKVAGVERLLDVGNGGVFCYDTASVGSITAIDLFLEDLPDGLVKAHFPKNAKARQGSALALPEPDGSFDMVLMVMLLHHLAGTDWRTSWDNARKALAEAWRVLQPGGKLLIVESCVPPWFFALEKPAFRVLASIAGSVLSHPITFQYPFRMIEGELRNKTSNVHIEQIPKGRYVLQFGFKTPSFATPVQVYAFEAQKGEN